MNENEFFKLALVSFINKDKKYLIKVGDFEPAYLNKYIGEDRYFLSDMEPNEDFKTHFTGGEIVELIKSDTLYLDWERVEFVEVKDDGQNENE